MILASATLNHERSEATAGEATAILSDLGLGQAILK
jgi:hypothetical protein